MVGGQAVINGVMMRVPGFYATAVRDSNAKIVIDRHMHKSLVEKYNILAKEALLTGDEILSENFFQHADHFARIIEQKNLNQNKNKIPPAEQASVSDNKLTKKIEINQVEEIKKK